MAGGNITQLAECMFCKHAVESSNLSISKRGLSPII